MKLLSVAAFVLAGACATPEQVRDARIPPTNQAQPIANQAQPNANQAQPNAVLEGTMEVLIEDSAQSSRTLYFLLYGDRRVPLQFTSPPPHLTTGTRVRVRGQWAEDGAFVVASFERI